MRAIKVNEMIDPYASEDDNMNLPTFKKNLLQKAEEWCEKWFPWNNFEIDDNANITFPGMYIVGIDRNLTELPNNLTIEGVMVIDEDSILEYLPENLTIGRDFNMAYTKYIKEIPSSIKIGGSLRAVASELEKMPDNLTISKNLELNSSKVTKLPKNLFVDENLYINNTKIDVLPDDLTVNGSIFVNYNQIKYINDDFKGLIKYVYPRGFIQYNIMKKMKELNGLTYSDIVKIGYEIRGDRKYSRENARGHNASIFRKGVPYLSDGWVTTYTEKVGKKYHLTENGLKKLESLHNKFKDIKIT